MNVTLLDKSLILPFFFLEQLFVCTSLHIENTNYMYMLHIGLHIGFLYTPNQAQWKKKITGLAALQQGGGIHHKALTFRASRKHSESLFLTFQFNLLQTCTSEVQELVGRFRLTWKITYRLQELITLKTPL